MADSHRNDATEAPLILYLHGFNSSPQSQKATQLRTWLTQRRVRCVYLVPSIPSCPIKAIDMLEALCIQHEHRAIRLIGSSLGGYYALWLSHRFRLPAAIINPAVRPYELLLEHLGPNTNPYTGEQFELTEAYLDHLKRYALEQIERPEQVFLLAETGDETLDYRQALALCKGCRSWIRGGGNHAFEQFEASIAAILAFLQVPVPSA